MRRTLPLLPYILGMALIMAGIVSCSKDGPAGPAGAAGPAGPQGPSGPAGPAGQPGTANVITSGWLDVKFDTVWNSRHDTIYYYSGTINATKLDTAILNRGEVKTYVNLGTSANATVVALPVDANVWGILLSPYYQLGKIKMIGDDDYSTFTNSGSKYFQYRYILIPGGTTARTAGTVNWNDYKQVQAYLGLKD